MTEPFPDPPPPSPPAGWYDEAGRQRWWDGAQWGPYAPPALPASHRPDAMIEQGRALGMFAHLGFIVLSVVVPLVIRVTEGDRNPYVRHHATEALNFQLTVLVVGVGAALVSLAVGFANSVILLVVLLPVWIAIAVTAFVLSIIAAVRAYQGDWYRYPLNIRFVAGVVDRPTPG